LGAPEPVLPPLFGAFRLVETHDERDDVRPVFVGQCRENQRFLHQLVAAVGARREICVRIDDAAVREADRDVLADDAHIVGIERETLAIVGPGGSSGVGIGRSQASQPEPENVAGAESSAVKRAVSCTSVGSRPTR
jgi:hypothetical protein